MRDYEHMTRKRKMKALEDAASPLISHLNERCYLPNAIAVVTATSVEVFDGFERIKINTNEFLQKDDYRKFYN